MAGNTQAMTDQQGAEGSTLNSSNDSRGNISSLV